MNQIPINRIFIDESTDENRRGHRHYYQKYDHPPFVPNWEEKIENFEQLNLKPEILDNISSLDYISCTGIISMAIKPIIMERNVFIQSPFHFSQLISYIIGILQRINTEDQTIQALILLPTENIFFQVEDIIASLSHGMENFHFCFIAENFSVEQRQKEIEKHPHIIISTPNVLFQLYEQNIFRCESLKIICLDSLFINCSSDQMLAILNSLEIQKIVILDNAKCTYHFTQDCVKDPIQIHIRNEISFEKANLHQFYVNVDKPIYKTDTLIDIYNNLSISKVIFFANTSKTVYDLQNAFLGVKSVLFPVICGDYSLEVNQVIMDRFIKGSSKILFGTDIINKLDFNSSKITLIINFEMPLPELYSQRIRCEKGVINLCNSYEVIMINEINFIQELPENFNENFNVFPKQIINNIKEFEQLNLKPELIEGILKCGYKTPYKKQISSIQQILLDENIIVQSPCNSGKTVSYIIGILQKINTDLNKTQALIIAPTKEKSEQICKLIQCIAVKIEKLRFTNINNVLNSEQKELIKTSHIIVSTPNIDINLFSENYIICAREVIICFDGADEIFSESFIDYVKNFLQYVPQSCQILLYSTSYPQSITDILMKSVINPIKI